MINWLSNIKNGKEIFEGNNKINRSGLGVNK